MIFGCTPIGEAEDTILAHGLKSGSINFKKGRVLSGEDLARLRAAGVQSVVVARLEPDDAHEDEAAGAIAAAVAGEGLTATGAFTGRCNLVSEKRGLLVVDRERLDRLNLVDEAVTLATLAPYDPVEVRQMAATIKIIPFAVPRPVLDRCLAAARDGPPLLRVADFAARKVGLLQTTLPGLKAALLDKMLNGINARLAALNCPSAVERRCDHEPAAVARGIGDLASDACEIILIAGATAIVDRRDVVPSALEQTGGRVEHFGMPVDPGNLLLLGRLGETPVIGLPGCARSPKLNGFDWVLQRLVAGEGVSGAEVSAMGAGGLLKEVAGRPLPRAAAVEATEGFHVPHIAAIVLAAGRSTRMGPSNKLLAEIDGRPMIAHAAAAALASQADPVVVVTGHEAEKVGEALANLEIIRAHNPDYAVGLSTSLHRGLAALPETVDGALVLLGDMPRVSARVLDRLIAAFNPLEGRSICLPTWQGKRGNPVLFARRFFSEMQAISGDVGARALIGDYPELICEVPMPDDAVLSDVDTPENLVALRSAQ